ncbi:hypothetical protein GCM10020256_07900 [Streptomyces thermocoprophilus]
MRSSSGRSTSVRRTGQGWKVRVPYWAAQTTAASSVGHISSALRPLGKVMWAVGIQSGMLFGARFW